MANYKKLETLVKNFETLTDDILNEIVNNEEVDVSTLSDREKFSCLVFAEMKKALETKNHELVLDCNYPQSKKHNKKNPEDNEWLVDYYRLVSKDTKNSSMIQFYVSANPKKNSCSFTLCTSCAKANLEQFLALRDDLQFEPLTDKAGKPKTTTRKGIQYDELVDVVKAVCAVLANNAKKEEPKKDEPKEETEE